MEGNTHRFTVSIGSGRFAASSVCLSGSFFAKCILEEVWEEGEMLLLLLLHVECKALSCDRLRGRGYAAYGRRQLHPLRFIAVTEEERKTVRKTEEKEKPYQLAVSNILCPSCFVVIEFEQVRLD